MNTQQLADKRRQDATRAAVRHALFRARIALKSYSNNDEEHDALFALVKAIDEQTEVEIICSAVTNKRKETIREFCSPSTMRHAFKKR